MTRTKPSEDIEYVEAEIIAVTVPPLRVVPKSEVQEETFTRGHFEGALDKVSRPLKGKYADVLPSSEDFIEQKRKEVELEDGLS
jgi:hypothetical protein